MLLSQNQILYFENIYVILIKFIFIPLRMVCEFYINKISRWLKDRVKKHLWFLDTLSFLYVEEKL